MSGTLIWITASLTYALGLFASIALLLNCRDASGNGKQQKGSDAPHSSGDI